MSKDLIDKLSSYNLFNYLLPGVIFSYFAERFVGYSVIRDNVVIDVFVFYFIGLVISRIGSLVIEPFLKKVGLVKFAEYHDFVQAASIDPKIEILSESNNSYRTLVSTFLLLGLLMLYRFSTLHFSIAPTFNRILAIVFLATLFFLSYRKQSQYITKRIASRLKSYSEKDK